MMLMSMKNINQTSLRSCCKDCIYGNGNRRGRKENRRHAKRSERQSVRRDIRNYS